MQKIKQILFTVAGIAFVTVLPHSGLIPVPFGYSIPVLLFIWLVLRWQKEPFKNTGFSFARFSFAAVGVGLFSGIALFVFLQYIFFPLLNHVMVLKEADLSDFKQIRHHTGNYVFMLLMGWLIGGVYEEIVFHGFIFTRIEKLFTGNAGTGISFAITNIIFATYHWQLGTSGVINALLAGMFYHALMLRFKRNLWYAIICHAIFDTIGLTFIYAGYW